MYRAFEGLQPHEEEFLAIRAQGKHVAGLDAARALIRQCRLVRYRRHLELTTEATLKQKSAAAREQQVEDAFLNPMTRTALELCPNGERLTLAEAKVLQAEVIPMPAPAPFTPDPEPIAA